MGSKSTGGLLAGLAVLIGGMFAGHQVKKNRNNSSQQSQS